MYVLDTNTLIYFFRGEGRVAEHLLATPPSDVAIPAICLFELEVGIAKSVQPVERRRPLDDLVDVVRVLAFDRAAAVAAAGIRTALERVGRPIGLLDTLSAGIALALGGTLITHNTHEFTRVSRLVVEDWYE